MSFSPIYTVTQYPLSDIQTILSSQKYTHVLWKAHYNFFNINAHYILFIELHIIPSSQKYTLYAPYHYIRFWQLLIISSPQINTLYSLHTPSSQINTIKTFSAISLIYTAHHLLRQTHYILVTELHAFSFQLNILYPHLK